MINQSLDDYLELMHSGKFTWENAEKFLKISEDRDWEQFFKKFEAYRHDILGEKKELKIYTPGSQFPSISVTGSDCSLNCEHCDKKYLQHMLKGNTEELFNSALKKIIEKGGSGALLSGGCEEDGTVPILQRKEQIQSFKEKHPDFFNSGSIVFLTYSC